MTKFLFWNLNRKPLILALSNVVSNYDVDVILLAECSLPSTKILQELNRNKTEYHYSPSICKKVTIFTRFSDRFIPPIFESDRLTIRHLKLPAKMDILLAVIHFPSKLYQSEESQTFESVKLANSIKTAEQSVKHTRTVLVGDLNMNPFETGVVGAGGLNAVMSKVIAKRNARTVQSEIFPFFYNPMWSLFGDATPGPSGTYYYNPSEHKAYFWNIFDQVLVRPDLIDSFNDSSLEILASDGEASLLTANGLPDTYNGSDHLPIFFTLNL